MDRGEPLVPNPIQACWFDAHLIPAVIWLHQNNHFMHRLVHLRLDVGIYRDGAFWFAGGEKDITDEEYCFGAILLENY